MASYIQGYDEERFASTVSQNFICSICFNVLKDPVLCPRNHHCFCRGCITKHLENSQRCPTCADELTVETLAEPQRMVKDILNELKIHCIYKSRGCQESVQLQHIDQHEATCGFTPTVCTNQGCVATLSQRDLIHHESEVCEFRKLKCHSCGEVTKTLADIEKRMAKMEDVANMETHIKANIEKRMMNAEMKIETRIANVEKMITHMETDMEGKFQIVNNEVIGLKTALIESFDEMKDVLVKMEDKIKENARKVRNTPSGDRENIIVAGGRGSKSAEMFNWRQRTWSPLQSMADERYAATRFVYNNHMTIAGGWCPELGWFDSMIKMSVDPNPDLSSHWSESPGKLPSKLADHSSVLCKNRLIITGGYDGNASDRIQEAQLVPPYTGQTLSRMPEPRRNHSTEILDDSLFIVGGSTTHRYQDNLSSVVLYDIKKNECKQLAPLPYEVSYMATLRWGDNIVVIGGRNKRGKILDTVIIYNVKTEQSHMLPRMRCKRWGCTAVVVRNNIVVLGGVDEQGALKSVEAFNFESYTWQELPEMSQERWYHTAVVV